MTKKRIIIFFFLLMSSFTYAQSEFDKSLNLISTDISEKLNKLNKKKIVVLYVNDINKEITNTGKYLADVISVNIVNSTYGFQVFDRDNLKEIVEAKKLVAEGYLSTSSVKEIAKILAVDVLIIGNYTILSNTIKLTLKALDADNGFVIAASMHDLPINQDAASLLGINIGGANTNKGFNAPLGSSEQYNNPRTVDQKCEAEKLGDYCFHNNTKKALVVTIGENMDDIHYYSSKRKTITLEPEQTQCFYLIPIGAIFYEITEVGSNNRQPRYSNNSNYNQPASYYATGQILIEKCKSKTFTIR